MTRQNRLVCNDTGESYPCSEPRWRSESGGLLQLAMTPQWNITRLAARKPTLWRYREVLPIDQDEHIVSFDEGFTPLLPIVVAGRTVFFKQDHLFPSGSFKDRGAAVLISKVKELGIKQVVQDSSGNAGCSVAAYCARAGIACHIYVPQSTSPAKLAQIRRYGAMLHLVAGTRQDAADAAFIAAQKYYYASHCWNPYFHHGVKTIAYEICEQLGWRSPGAMVMPVGNGSLFLGAFIGFEELCRQGMIERMPRLVGVQAEACAPIATAFAQQLGDIAKITTQTTMAEGIAIAAPIRGREILAAVRETNGRMLTVNESEIERAQEEMGRRGFYLEATAATAVAGVEAFIREADPDGAVVSVLTGHGLKDKNGPTPSQKGQISECPLPRVGDGQNDGKGLL